jgi:aspartyl-tRNA(Asn)/glutamyl-tRNA(Gln) amidotransferase subunit C
MERLTRKDVEEIAHLARLELDDREVERLRSELGAILEHIDRLRALDTTGVEPMTHAVPMDLRLREDEPTPSLSQDQAVAQAPDSEDGSFRVPPIIETSS